MPAYTPYFFLLATERWLGGRLLRASGVASGRLAAWLANHRAPARRGAHGRRAQSRRSAPQADRRSPGLVRLGGRREPGSGGRSRGGAVKAAGGGRRMAGRRLGEQAAPARAQARSAGSGVAGRANRGDG